LRLIRTGGWELPWSKCEKEWSTEDCFMPDAAEACVAQSASYFKGKCLNSTQMTAMGLIENITGAIRRPPAEEYFQ